jgi:hypothetical protein
VLCLVDVFSVCSTWRHLMRSRFSTDFCAQTMSFCATPSSPLWPIPPRQPPLCVSPCGFLIEWQIYFGPSIPTISLLMIKAPELTQIVVVAAASTEKKKRSVFRNLCSRFYRKCATRTRNNPNILFFLK